MKTKQSSAVVEPITKVHNTLDFSNKVLYVGIDVHKKRQGRLFCKVGFCVSALCALQMCLTWCVGLFHFSSVS